MSASSDIQLLGDDNQHFPLNQSCVNIYPSQESALDYEQVVASAKLKLKPAVKYFWDYQYYMGRLICRHPFTSLVAYCINNKCVNPSGATTTTSMVRIRNPETAQKLLLKNFAGKVLTMEFASHIEPTLAILDMSRTLRVYKIGPSNCDADLLNVDCILVLLADESQSNSVYQFLNWCPWTPASSSALDSLHEENDGTLLSSDCSMLLAVSSGKRAELIDITTASQEFKARFPSGSTYGVSVDRADAQPGDSTLVVGLTRLDLSQLPTENSNNLLSTTDHGDSVSALLLSSNAAFLVTGCLDGKVRVFSLLSQTSRLDGQLIPIHEFTPHDGIAIHGLYFVDKPRLDSDSKPIVDNYLLTGSQFNHELRLWSVPSWNCLQTLRFCAAKTNPSTTATSSLLPSTKPSLVLTVDRLNSLLIATDITRRALYIIPMAPQKSAVSGSDGGSQALDDVRLMSITEFLLCSPCIMFALGSCERRTLPKSGDSATSAELIVMELHAIHSWYLLNGTITFELPQLPNDTNSVEASPFPSSDIAPCKIESPNSSNVDSVDETTQVPQQLSDENAVLIENTNESEPVIEPDEDVLHPEPSRVADEISSFATPTNAFESDNEKITDEDMRPLRPADLSLTRPPDEASEAVINQSASEEPPIDAPHFVPSNAQQDADLSALPNPPAVEYLPESIEDAMEYRRLSDKVLRSSDQEEVSDAESQPLIEFEGPNQFADHPNVLPETAESASVVAVQPELGELRTESAAGSIGNAASLLDFLHDEPDGNQCFDEVSRSNRDLPKRQGLNASTVSLYSCSSRASAKEGRSSGPGSIPSSSRQLDTNEADSAHSDPITIMNNLLKKLLLESDTRNQQIRLLLADMKETKEQIQILSKTQTELAQAVLSKVANATIHSDHSDSTDNQTADWTSRGQPNSDIKRNYSGDQKDDINPPEWSKQLLSQLRTQQGDFARRFTHMEGLMSKVSSMTTDLNEMHRRSNTKPGTSETRIEHVPKLTVDLIRPVLRSEIHNAFVNNTSRMVDPLHQTVQRAIQEGLNTLPSLTADNVSRIFRDKNFATQMSRALSASLCADLTAAYRDALSKIFVPALERNVSRLFEEVNTVFRTGSQQYLEEISKRIPTVLNSSAMCDQIVSEIKHTLDKTTLSAPAQTGLENTGQTFNAHPCNSSDVSKTKASLPFAGQEVLKATDDSKQKPASVVKSSWVVNRDTSDSPAVVTQPTTSNTSSSRVPNSGNGVVQQAPTMSLTKKEEFARLSGQARTLIRSHRFAEALELALVSTNQPLVLDVCGDIDPYQLFASGEHPIGQNVILSLIHQLSCGDFKVELELKARYLQEAVACLNINDPTTIEHGPRILTLLVRRLERFLESCSKGSVPKLTPQMQSRLAQVKWLAKNILETAPNRIP